MKSSRSGDAGVNRIRLDHEIDGEGELFVLIPGGLTTIDLCRAKSLPRGGQR